MQAPHRWDNKPPIVIQPRPSEHSTRSGVDNVSMGSSRGPPNCPPGLENLAMIDQLFIYQKLEILEIVIGFETQNRYDIKNRSGQLIYKAKEDTDCCTRNLCGPLRPFEMNIFDTNENMVINLSRPLACAICCFPCCMQYIEIFAPPGQLAGRVQQEWSICMPAYYPVFTIRNSADEVVFHIKGPCCTVGFCSDVEFKVMSADGLFQVGRITKNWSGVIREIITDSDFFSISFPLNIDVKMKAVMLGACFLIDFIFFEH